MNIDVYVATHKKVNLTLPNYCHLIQVGSAQNEKFDGYLHDDDWAINISNKNDSYCELTALYCLWKHSKADIKGLFHYRRMFYNGKPLKYNKHKFLKKGKTIDKYCINQFQIETFLTDYDVIVEIPYCPGFYKVRKDLEHFCYVKDIDKLDVIIEKYFPEYLESYLSVMNSYHISYCNMIITKKDILDDYCEWLFSVLDKCENTINIINYDKGHKRIYGYFAEILMNVYIKHKKFKEKRVPVVCVFEYTGNLSIPAWLRWLRSNLSQFLSIIGVSLPIAQSRLIKIYNKWVNDNADIKK